MNGLAKGSHASKDHMPLSLQEGIETAAYAMEMCLTNQFTAAKDFLKPVGHASIYHALSLATISYLQAIITYEHDLIQEAFQQVKEASHICDKYRRKQNWNETLHALVVKQSYDDFTDDELHAELCYAECLLQSAALTFIQDENLISFIKGGLKVRHAYNLYKACLQVVEQRPKSLEASPLKIHFESGVFMGVGSFNLLLSLLPAKILRLLEWVGFSGNKKLGLSLLERGYHLDGLRSPMCTITLLGYHIVVSPILGIADIDVDYVERILGIYLEKYPGGSIFLYFNGRLKQTQGLLDEAIHEYEKSISQNLDWKQVHHICYWELMWCHSFKGLWSDAAKYAELLAKESKWSKSSYLYLEGAFLLMHQIERKRSKEHTKEQQQEADVLHDTILHLFRQVPEHKQRIAGKSLPFEKFAVNRAEKYQTTGFLVLPGLEVIHLWNGFSMFRNHGQELEHFHDLVEEVLGDVLARKGVENAKIYEDNFSLCKLLQGICFRCLNRPDLAEEALLVAARSPPSLHSSKMDCYYAPYASAEIGFIHKELGNYAKALEVLKHTLKHYSDYGLESRLHFRVHSSIQVLKEQLASSVSTTDSSDDLDSLSSRPSEELFTVAD